MNNSFEKLGIGTELIEGLKSQGITEPMEIQERVDGQWAGFSEFELAYFKDKGDARLCEELLEDSE